MALDLDQISREIALRKTADALRYIDRLGLKNFAPEYFHALTSEVFLREFNLPRALTEIDRAISGAPSWAPAHNIRGNILTELARFDEALASFNHAIGFAPQVGEYRFNRGQLLLLLGRWSEARDDYEFRLNSPLFQPTPEVAARPLWRGESNPSDRVLLYWEQGQGDTLQFVRFAQRLIDIGIPVTLEVQDSLSKLIAQSFPTAEVIGSRDPLPDFTYRASLPSLPWLLGVSPDTIAPQVYLHATPDPVLAGQLSRPAVGLVWAGNPNHVNDRQRSIAQADLLAATRTPGIGFYSLQVGMSDKQQRALARAGVDDLASGVTNFADTAAVIQSLDLVITVDTSVAHLAGALGKPVWILLPFVPDWRWLLDRNDSPWYPSARLFRQPRRGDWGSVLKTVKQALTAYRDQWVANNAA